MVLMYYENVELLVFLPSYMQNRQDNNGIKVLVMKKGNCGDMRKFHVTLHFFEVTVLRSGPQGNHSGHSVAKIDIWLLN